MRTWSALVAASLLTLGLAACTGTTTPGDGVSGEDGSSADKAAMDGKGADADKVEAKVETKPAAGQDCAGVRPKDVDLASLEAPTLPDDADPALTDPTKATATAPDVFKIRLETSEGPIVIEAHREWSPKGVDRLYNLVKIGYLDGVKFFRNVEGFMVQFGISGYPAVNAAWSEARFDDEPVVKGNQRGYVTFAKCGLPNCRSTQLFINHKDNSFLDGQGFAAVGKVVEGMDVVDKLYSCYGEGQPRGMGPRQDLVQKLGNAYLDAAYPELSTLRTATIEE
jgi:peptidyl-prolyl cis-trans isomerase A (cyclophilin A)